MSDEEMLLRQWYQSPEIDELAKALCKAQAAFTTVPKKGKGKIAGKSKATGKSYDYEYAYALYSDILEMAKKPLTDNGLALLYQPESRGILTTKLLHASGQYIACSLGISGSTPQALGSSISYMRRYATSCVLGISTEDDDDGQQAEEDAKKMKRQKAAAPQAAPSTQPATPGPSMKTLWPAVYRAGEARGFSKQQAEEWFRKILVDEYQLDSTKKLTQPQANDLVRRFHQIAQDNTHPEE